MTPDPQWGAFLAVAVWIIAPAIRARLRAYARNTPARPYNWETDE